MCAGCRVFAIGWKGLRSTESVGVVWCGGCVDTFVGGLAGEGIEGGGEREEGHTQMKQGGEDRIQMTVGLQ